MLKTNPARSLISLAVMGLLAVSVTANATPLFDGQSPVAAGKNVYQTVYGTQDNSVYVAAAGGDKGEIHVFSGRSLKPESVISMQDKPLGLAIDQQHNLLFTGNTFNGSVTKIDLTTGKVLANLTLSHRAPKGTPRDQWPPMVHAVFFDEAHNAIYVTGAAKQGVVWKVNATTFKLEKTIRGVGAVPTGMALDHDTGLLYVTVHSDNKIAVIDTQTDRIVKTIGAGKNPLAIAINRQLEQLYVANSKDNTIGVFDLKSDKRLALIKTDKFPVDVNVDPTANRLLVANRSSGTVQVFNTDTYVLEKTLHPGLHPNTLAVDKIHHQAYVTSKGLRRHEKSMPKGISNTAADVITQLTE